MFAGTTPPVTLVVGNTASVNTNAVGQVTNPSVATCTAAGTHLVGGGVKLGLNNGERGAIAKSQPNPAPAFGNWTGQAVVLAAPASGVITVQAYAFCQ